MYISTAFTVVSNSHSIKNLIVLQLFAIAISRNVGADKQKSAIPTNMTNLLTTNH